MYFMVLLSLKPTCLSDAQFKSSDKALVAAAISFAAVARDAHKR
jgi:hypothetical protein